MRIRLLVPALVLTLTGAALTGCAGSDAASSAGSQATADACAAVGASVADAVERLRTIDVSDPTAAAAAMNDVANRLGEATSAIDNADVSALLPPLRNGFAEASTALQNLAGGDLSRLPALQQATGDIQSAFARFADLCAAP